MELRDLATPCALVELERLERNAAVMAEKAMRLGVRLRPHVKTHKCTEIARLQTDGHFGGITVSTLAEARFFAAAGFADITYAVPIAPERLREVAELDRHMGRLSLLIDDAATLAEVEACSEAPGVRLSVFLKVDCGGRRAGVDPKSEEGAALAARLHASPVVDFRGILTHAGHAYASRNRQEALEVARQERDVMVAFAARLRDDGIPVPEVSIGSTPTAMAIDHLDGVTEIRPGNYVFFDAFQASIGSCAIADLAFTVLATVIGRYPARREVLVNAGALALSRDPGPVHASPSCGFGMVLAEDGVRHLDHLSLVSLSQEHGIVRSARALAPGELAIGARLRIAVNHSCLAAALHDRYRVVRGKRVVDEWRPVRGW